MKDKNVSTPAVELWSSVEYAGFGRALVAALKERCVQASLCYEIPQKDYWSAKGRLARLLLRTRAYLLYPFRVALRMLLGNPSATAVVSTNTFYAPFVAVVGRLGRGRITHWVLDLYPDVLVVDGRVVYGGLLDRGLGAVVGWTIRRVDMNVFLGSRLLAHASSRFGEIPNATIIPIGADGRPFRAHPPKARGHPIRVLYAGNLGRMHDLETIEGAIREGIPVPLNLAFMATGSVYRDFKRRLLAAGAGSVENRDGCGVYLGTCAEDELWVREMLRADIALVSLKRGAEKVVMPSKTYSAMVAGQAILAIAVSDSDLAETVIRYDCGWVVEPGDIAGLRRLLVHISVSRAEVDAKRRAAFEAGHKYFDQSVLAQEWYEKVVVPLSR